MNRQLTASLESGDALLSIAVPVREETGGHLPTGSALFPDGEPTYKAEGEAISEDDLQREYGDLALWMLSLKVWSDGTLTEEWDGLHD